MVEIPTSRAPRVRSASSRPGGSGPGASIGSGLSDLGEDASRAGRVLEQVHIAGLEEEASAQAKERDALVSDQIRSLLYDPATGFANLSGQNAVNQRKSTMDALDKFSSSAMEGLSESAKSKLESSVRSRIDAAQLTVFRHTSGARRDWLAGASEARINAAFEDAIIDGGETESSLIKIEGEVRESAKIKGLSAAETEQEVLNAKSAVYTAQIKRISASDPIRAMEYLRANQDSMSPIDVVNLEADLQPAVKRYVGRQRARDRAMINPQAGATLVALETAIGFPLKVISGYRSPQHNEAVGGAKNSQHTHGNAFDVDVKHMSVSERQDLIVAARQAGFSGIGVYNNSLHFDVGGDRFWGSSYGHESLPGWANEAVRTPIGNAPSGSSTMDVYLDTNDPIEADAFLSEVSVISSLAAGEENTKLANAQNQAFQIIDSGGSIEDIDVESRKALGLTAMSSLRTYEQRVRSGSPSETDPQTYYSLRLMSADDPAQFRNLNLMEYVDRLSKSDFKAMTGLQTSDSSSVNGIAASTLMTVAKRQLEGAGIDTTPKDGSSDSKRLAGFQTALLKWQDEYIATNNKAPTQTEIDQRIGELLLPVILNPAGIFGDNRKDKTSLDRVVNRNSYVKNKEELSELETVDGVISVDGLELPAEIVSEIIQIIQVVINSGEPLSVESIVDTFLTIKRQRQM